MPDWMLVSLIEACKGDIGLPVIEIYTLPTCPFCLRAKSFLNKKGIPFTEIDVSQSLSLRAKMSERANGRHTVPQIFIGGEAIGGYSDLIELDFDGGLDDKLGLGAAL